MYHLVQHNIISDTPRCLKFIERVAFNIASEASYVYISSGQKLIKKAKNGQLACGVIRQVPFIRTKIGRKCPNGKNSNTTLNTMNQYF